MKRILSLTIAILMGLCLFVGGEFRAAQAESDFEIDTGDRYFSIEEDTVPDPVLRNWILVNLQGAYTEDAVPYFTVEQAAAVTELDLSGAMITSLQGLEYFYELKTLDCSRNPIGTINLNAFPQLLSLCCDSCNLSRLDVRTNTKLQQLSCRNNKLTTLDLSKNTALQSLYCDGNRLAYMDLRSVKNLDTNTASLSSQQVESQGTYNNGTYTFNLTKLIPQKYLGSVTLSDASNTFNKNTGVVTFSGRAAQFTYQFDTLKDPSGGAIELPPIPNDAQATRERPRYMEITVTLSYQGEPTQPLPGDANGDGKVNVADASTVLRYLVGLAQLSGQCLLNADVDGIEGVSAQDALEIVRYCIGLTAALPAA